MRINEVDKPITQADIDQLEIFADRLFAKVGIDVEFTRHFLDRVNDERNIRQITMSELTRLFKQEFKRWGKKIAQLGPDAEAVFKDLQTDVNMPFALRYDKNNNELDLIAKTVMRKDDFRTSNPEFAIGESTLTEGGAMPGVGAIHIDEIEPTLIKLEKSTGLNMRDFVLGSVGKREFSGDIDIAINLKPEQLSDFADKLEKDPNFEEVTKSSVFMTKVKIENFDSDKSDGRPRTGYVQVDFMPGDPGWMKTYYHSPREDESKYKGVFRNVMIATISAVFNRQDSQKTTEDGRPLESERYMFSPRDGLVRIKRTPVPKASGNGYTKKNKNEIIEGPWRTADEIAEILNLGSGANLNSFETLLAALKKNHTPEVYAQVVKGFVENPTVQDIGVPEELG